MAAPSPVPVFYVASDKWGSQAHDVYPHAPLRDPARLVPRDQAQLQATLQHQIMTADRGCAPFLASILYAMDQTAELAWTPGVVTIGAALVQQANLQRVLLFARSGFDCVQRIHYERQRRDHLEAYLETLISQPSEKKKMTQLVQNGSLTIPAEQSSLVDRLFRDVRFTDAWSKAHIQQMVKQSAEYDAVDDHVRDWLIQWLQGQNAQITQEFEQHFGAANNRFPSLLIERCSNDVLQREAYVRQARAHLEAVPVPGAASRYRLAPPGSLPDTFLAGQPYLSVQQVLAGYSLPADKVGLTARFCRRFTAACCRLSNDVGKCAGAKLAMRIKQGFPNALRIWFGEAAWGGKDAMQFRVDFEDEPDLADATDLYFTTLTMNAQGATWRSDLVPSCISCQQQIVDFLTPAFWTQY